MEDYARLFAVCEHALSLSKALDRQSEGRGVLQLKTGLISHMKRRRAGRTPATRNPETRSKIIEDFYKNYRQKHHSDIQPPHPKDPEEVKMRKIKVRRTLGVLQNVLRSDSKWLPREFIAELDSDLRILGAPYNILPLSEEPGKVILKLSEVIAAKNGLKVPAEICIDGPWKEDNDIFDALEVAFRFQSDNLKNQREHLVLLLANTESELYDRTAVEEHLHDTTIQQVCDEILGNYRSWCSYIRKKCVYDGVKESEKLAFAALYLCIWGEAANVRFLPECLCFLFHNFAQQLKAMLGVNFITCSDCFSKDNSKKSFLEKFIVPIYTAISKEAEKGKNQKAHSKWRNYDDFNEFFWLESCFGKMKGWPMVDETSSSFFNDDTGKCRRSKKVSFVEHRTFLHLYHSFVRVWILLVLMLQGMSALAFTQQINLTTLKILLSLGPTFFAMKLIESVLDIVMMMGVHVVSRGDALARIIIQSLFYGGSSCGIGYLYWKMLLEKPPSHFYLRLILYVLGSYATLKLIISLFQHMPSVRRQVEKMDNSKTIAYLKWLYKERFFVGRGLYEHSRYHIRYAGFWIILLTCKFSFSYYFQILPLAKASKIIFSHKVMVRYVWHDLVSQRNHNALALFFLWAPVVLIYLLDIQIWYIIFSAITGGIIGAKDRLGEIRSLDMIRTRFESFPMAYARNLQHTREMDPSGTPPEKDFAPFWNTIIKCMRDEDYITNEEKDLLVMPTENDYIKWPLFLLTSQVSLAVKLAKEKPEALLKKLRTDRFMKSAVEEAYKSTIVLLKEIFGDNPEHPGVQFFDDIHKNVNSRIQQKTFSKNFLIRNIEPIHSQVTDLLKQLDNATPMEDNAEKKKLEEKIEKAVVKIYHAVLQFLIADQREAIKLPNPERTFTDAKLPTMEKKEMIWRLRLLLTTKESGSSVPKNREAQRRLEFFTNSLFMRMPIAPSVRAMKSFSVLTPYYKETVIFSLEDLLVENEDGISILFYLQKIFPDEWNNFLERLNISEKAPTKKLQKPESDPEMVLETRLWASYRGQTLARTVRGMMYYKKALELQAFMEASGSGTVEERKAMAEALADLKFTYVVSCQIYGAQTTSSKKEEHAKADDIRHLMKVYGNLRIAFIHSVETAEENNKNYYSKLVKIGEDGKDQEIYSIKLPGDPILGEGKPENQNHAIIFTRGVALQTIDMNQDNYFEEALKMRNLLQEFRADYGGPRKPTILGVREHIFTGSVSSLAWFMSNQERSFVTIGQRVLARPLKVRMHYGHPDVFDRLFHLTRGGISKASKTINVSEDIFAGFNSTLRKGNITHHEYIQVGKGRDVGLNQIAMFEAKVSGGNGEQLLSRDVYRLGQLFDFFRMLSFYVTSVGYYACTMMTVLAVYFFLYGKAYLALSGVGASLSSLADYTHNQALRTALDTQFLLQIGIFTTIPMLVVFMLEEGFFKAIYYFIAMQLQLSSVFFTFSMGTRSHYFGQTVLHGGAKYQETGRGFVVRHIKFAQNYRLYSRSHFVKALDIVMLLLVIQIYGPYGSTNYLLFSLFSWFLALSWLFAPFIFNPSGFEWQKTVEDFDDWTNWLLSRGGVGVNADDSWETWWNEGQKSSGLSKRIIKSLFSLRFLLIQFGVVYHLKVINHNTGLEVYGISWLVFLGVILICLIFSSRPRSLDNNQMVLRLGQGVIFIILVTSLVVALALGKVQVGDVFASLLALIPTGWGLLSIAVAWSWLMNQLHLWRVVRDISWYYDAGMGILIFLPIAILSWFPFISTFQTRLLFNQAFSRGLEISLILAGGKKSYDQASTAKDK
ncbi:hypothetical protein GOP47_0011092 [Adiantum capillus-veneris]|uniref:1,3-beta-glucan synthase n=1 Tax=Adiantum capillus-veneris TaxID=13818 RepID=A0A9D4USJ2_ADICA|nr:hypothetical protein GOP47_0011092 [Adiantum capillus-veneris]